MLSSQNANSLRRSTRDDSFGWSLLLGLRCRGYESPNSMSVEKQINWDYMRLAVNLWKKINYLGLLQIRPKPFPCLRATHVIFYPMIKVIRWVRQRRKSRVRSRQAYAFCNRHWSKRLYNSCVCVCACVGLGMCFATMIALSDHLKAYCLILVTTQHKKTFHFSHVFILLLIT